MKPTRILIAALSMATSAVLAQPAGMKLSLGVKSATVSEVPPGHNVLVFGVAREAGQYYATVVRRERVLSPAPGERTATWDIGTPIALKSVWCAIDLQTGATDIAAPAGFALRRMTDAPAFSRNGAGSLASIIHQRADVFVLLVTPGRGTWILRSGDGGKTDEDPQAGKARIAFERFTPFPGNPPPPRALAANDVVIVIDPVYLEVWSGQVGREVTP